MDILIISTRDYYLYYQKEEQWKRCKCDEVIKFINDSYVSRNLECRTPIRNFFIKEGNATSFWRLGHFEFALLFHNHRNYRIYVMPCVPEFHISGTVDGALKLSDKDRQDYLGAILDDIYIHLNNENIKSKRIFLVAHDRDICSIGRDEKMRKEYLITSSKLEQHILNERLSPDNIYAFQHEPSKDMYKILLRLQDNEFPDNLIESIVAVIQSSAKLQADLDDD